MQPNKYPFSIMKLSKLWLGIAVTLISIGLCFIFFKGLNLGTDFTGGTAQLVRFQEKPSLNDIRQAFSKTEITGLDLNKLQLQVVEEKDIMFKTPELRNEQQKQMQAVLAENFGKVEVLESDTVGPVVGEQLKKSAFWIMLWAFGLLLIYIAFRFEVWYGVGAIIALVHDALITLGAASILHLEINTQFIAALLTILGYSINDTIVIFDRIRENFKKLKHNNTPLEITDISIWQTMTRSIYTVLTVLICLVSIFLFGGVTTREFALAMFIGITSGTYSSIFIASPIYVMLKNLEA